MYNSNYGYSQASSLQQPASLPFSSTPSNIRSQRPRFGYSGPSYYPRPGSSATKPNPDGFTESNLGEYGDPEDYVDSLSSKYPLECDYGNSYERGYSKPDGYAEGPMRSSYRNASEDYMNLPSQSNYGGPTDNAMDILPRYDFGNSNAYVNNVRGTTESMENTYGNLNSRGMDTSYPPMNNSFLSNNSSTLSQNTTAYFSCNESFYESPKKPLLGNTAIPFSNILRSTVKKPVFQGRFQNKKDKFKAKFTLAKKTKSTTSNNKQGLEKKTMASKSEWRCTVCDIEFTSGIPYDMHLRGAKHAKKMKLQEALESIQHQVTQNKEIAPVGNAFRCDVCNVTANSSLQLQTHLDGTKHKNKVTQQQQSNEKKAPQDSAARVEVNGKSNGAGVVRPLPSEFGEPQQAKMFKFSCDTCNLTVNSDIQLQQHLASKKHQAKVEGKPLEKRKFKRKKDDENEEKPKSEKEADDNATEDSAAMETTEAPGTDTAEGQERKMVVGVKTLAASFVQGDTLQ